MPESGLFVPLLAVFAIGCVLFGFVVGHAFGRTRSCPTVHPVAHVSPDGPAYACGTNGKIVPCNAP